MIGFQKRRLPSFVLALDIFPLGGIIRFTHAEELAAQTKPEEAQAAEEPGAQTKPKESQAKEATAAASAPGQAFDQALFSARMPPFDRSSTTCHKPSRSLQRTKNL